MTSVKKQIIEFFLDFEESLDAAVQKQYPWVGEYRVLSKSLDARGANKGKRPRYQYRLDVVAKGEKFDQPKMDFTNLGPLPKKPIIVGAGPAGLFAALRLAQHGIPCIILERGSKASERMKKIARFWRYGILDPEDNVCYGEGGAGLFSDGKLITRIKSPLISDVMHSLVEFGAPQEIAYISDPHLGSNKIRQLISRMTEKLQSLGVEIHYGARVEQLIIENGKAVAGVEYSIETSPGKREQRKIHSDHVILAFGHSATQFYYSLADQNIPMAAKDFAIGVRMEHSRRFIDQAQFGLFADSPLLGAARYRLSYHDHQDERGTYSFCMCPGGHVLSSGTEMDGIVTNGMSNFSRSSPWSNAALVVTVRAGQDYKLEEKTSDVNKHLQGLLFQRQVEQKAFAYSKERASGKEIPAQDLASFMKGNFPNNLPKSSCPSGTVKANLQQLLPNFVIEHLQQGLDSFAKQIPGLISSDALLLAPETRTSSPLKLLRDEANLQSPGIHGLYPCGEGAGHAGGITSAAVDGIKVAMALIASAKNYHQTLA